MIGKLRRKFILISMLSVFIALVLIIASINYLNFRNIVKDTDSIIEVLKINNGRFPDRKTEREDRFDDMIPPWDIINKKRPELEYESRFFVVYLDKDKNIVAYDMEFIVSVDKATAGEMVGKVLFRNSEKGFISSYRYCVTEDRIIFLESSGALSQFRSFLTTSLIISGTALVVSFLFIYILSGKILSPVNESYEKQKRFISDAGHELKTPLTIISADLDVIDLDESGNEWTEDIRQQVKRMSELTTDLIQLSHMEENGQTIKIAFPISDVASEISDSFRNNAALLNKTLIADIDQNLSYEGNEKEIRVLMNILLDNAIKYGKEGCDITFSLKKEGKDIVISTRNMTDDLNEEHVEHLFERFYRADKSRNSSSEGFGIGLSMAEQIIRNHRGSISAKLYNGEIVFRAVL